MAQHKRITLQEMQALEDALLRRGLACSQRRLRRPTMGGGRGSSAHLWLASGGEKIIVAGDGSALLLGEEAEVDFRWPGWEERVARHAAWHAALDGLLPQ